MSQDPDLAAWYEELAREFPEEAWLQIAQDYEPQQWHDLYFRAFDALRYDRFFGSYGGEGPIHYVAISHYARDHEIAGDDLKWFFIFMNAVDAEHLAMQAEADRERRDKQGNPDGNEH